LTLGQLLVSLDSNGGFPNGSRIGDYPVHFIGRDNHGAAADGLWFPTTSFRLPQMA
jgi:hypothetical protein